MVDKFIRGRIIEITVVLTFVILSVPLWVNFRSKYDGVVVTVEDVESGRYNQSVILPISYENM